MAWAVDALRDDNRGVVIPKRVDEAAEELVLDANVVVSDAENLGGLRI
jgi:hypothetical protein